MQLKTTPKKPSQRAFLLVVVLCLALSAIARINYCVEYRVQPRDAFYYVKVINNWEKTSRIEDSITFFPLSLWIMKLPHHLWGYDLIKGGIIVNVVLGLAIVLIVMEATYYYLKNIYVAAIIGVLFATHPTLVKLSSSFLRDNSYLFFLTITLVALADYWRKNRFAAVVIAGLCSALALLCRLEGFETVCFFLVITFFQLLIKITSFKKAILHNIAFLIVFLSTSFICLYLIGYDLKQINKTLESAKNRTIIEDSDIELTTSSNDVI